MIYDCFVFYNELDLLDMRLNILNSVVDRFVLVEGNKTFKGKEKPSYYLENKDRFTDFNHKITHLIADLNPNPGNPFRNEDKQGNTILEGLVECRDDDIIIFGDADEIARPESICPVTEPIILEMPTYYYYVNTVTTHMDMKPKIMPYRVLQDKSPRSIRKNKKGPSIKNAGWHFSYLGGTEAIKEKLSAFSHTPPTENIDTRVEKLVDLYDRNEIRISKVPLDDTFPQYLLNNQEKYKDFICST